MRKSYPDLNPGDREAEEKFKEVAGANDLLGDPEKRKKFDSGDIDAAGVEQPRQDHYYRDFASSGQDHPYANSAGFADFMDSEDALAELLKQSARGRELTDAVMILSFGFRSNLSNPSQAPISV